MRGTQNGGFINADLPVPKVQNHFGRLFDGEPLENQPDTAQLSNLAQSNMEDDMDPSGDSDVPAGVAFLGQFIDHDLTLDATTTLGQSVGDLTSIENFRTPRLELDSVYSHGPEVVPYLYDADENKFKLILGTDKNHLDLQRNRNDRAITGDPRNDENLIISQLHGRQFIALHNDAIDLANQGGAAGIDEFDRAREFVRSLYQHRIVDEFLPAVVDSAVLQPLLTGFENGKLPGPIDWSAAPDMPLEFSAAAFRFGHAMIRESYQLNAAKPDPVGLFAMGGFDEVPSDHNIDFNLFFDHGDGQFQKARKINTKLTPALLSLPNRVANNPANLAERNMIRGQHTFLLPFGENVADELFPGMKIPTHPAIKAVGLKGRTPLWFYILAEAEENDGKLGPVGGTIVAGTILNLLLREKQSIANNPSRKLLLSKFGVEPTITAIQAKFKAITLG